MSGYLSNLLTNTTSRYNSLRRNLLDDEADGNTEDDTHVCRVLRAYYTEKGHGLPQWLPPDPKKAIAPTPSASSYQSIWQSSSQQNTPTYNTTQSNSSRGALSDLWDPPAQARSSAPAQPTSLRRQPGQRQQQPEMLAAPVQARPMPSQRAGSYQTQMAQRSPLEPSPPTSSGSGTAGGGTAQERLKARLYGSGRAGSPSFGSSNTSGGGAGGSSGGRWG